ncbi:MULTISPECIES: trypsin-like serine protease [Mycolicibacter]|uniref:Peptidase S1 domain-containing protein n=1 Tax=Mycolicibacter longobardus TaxID=1108812 RepID=A0A1X1YBR6_9MYCO|nr:MULTISPECIES: trypsin-like serine protease [Mycolicibacter]ORW08496.1 hypothetical protein AWC16_19040 [Mycolicibacter longobardus]RAV04394.1 hypothetical protein DQP56_00825 [Mycolicibacter senuensis]
MRRVAATTFTATIATTLLTLAPTAIADTAGVVLRPGAKVTSRTAGGVGKGDCTAGFLARNRRGHPVLFSAGHCAHGDGSRLTMHADAGGEVPVAEFVVSEFEGAEGEATDIAVLKLANGVAATGKIDGRIPVSGWVSTVSEGDTVCKLGAVSGLDCGPVVEVSASKVKFAASIQRGDSGGPVFVMRKDGTAAAVGIIIRMARQRLLIAELIGPWLGRWNLTVG